MSVEEIVLNLLDTCWFEQTVFTPPKPALSASFLQEKEEDEETAADDNSVALITTTPMRKSYSDQFLSSSEPGSPSPKSVLGPHLQTILSGKEVQSFDDSLPEEEEKIQTDETADAKGVRAMVAQRGRDRRRGRRWKSGSRSLSELEFEELKGFMDLGFVFSDEDRNSRLVSIIPGLQRLGKDVGETDDVVSRPYLSEAWDSEGERGKIDPLMEWRIPSFGNEMELKDHLKCWAHTVASTVR